jgi:hypothetical protein
MPANVKVGRNERCLCGSGLKLKYCHAVLKRTTRKGRVPV